MSVFGASSTTSHIYNKLVRPIVSSCLEGYNGKRTIKNVSFKPKNKFHTHIIKNLLDRCCVCIWTNVGRKGISTSFVYVGISPDWSFIADFYDDWRSGTSRLHSSHFSSVILLYPLGKSAFVLTISTRRGLINYYYVLSQHKERVFNVVFSFLEVKHAAAVRVQFLYCLYRFIMRTSLIYLIPMVNH